MATFGQVGNPTNIDDQNSEGVFNIQDLQHGVDNNYLQGNKGLFQIGKFTAASAAQMDITRGFELSDVLEFHVSNFHPVSDNTSLHFRLFEAGSIEDQGVYDRGRYEINDTGGQAFSHSSTASGVDFCNGVGNDTYEFGNAIITLYNARTASANTMYYVNAAFGNSSNATVYQITGGELPQASVVDGIRFYFGTGNIETATVKMYGYED
jgi:hypothetical protein